MTFRFLVALACIAPLPLLSQTGTMPSGGERNARIGENVSPPVSVRPQGVVQATAIPGLRRVTTASGVVIADVKPGHDLEFAPQGPGTAVAVTYTAKCPCLNQTSSPTFKCTAVAATGSSPGAAKNASKLACQAENGGKTCDNNPIGTCTVTP